MAYYNKKCFKQRLVMYADVKQSIKSIDKISEEAPVLRIGLSLNLLKLLNKEQKAFSEFVKAFIR